MPETKTQRSAAARKGASTRRRHAVESKEHARASAVDRTTELSDEVFNSLESGQRAAIDAVRKFVDTVDEKLPALGERPSRRQEIVDAAMEMADRLVHTQYDFLRNVVQSAGKALSKPDDEK
ncbi:MAG: hypothetical protein ABSH36_04285 [Solirubrobacteraceae bacterium]